jgi:hypothetical protein
MGRRGADDRQHAVMTMWISTAAVPIGSLSGRRHHNPAHVHVRLANTAAKGIVATTERSGMARKADVFCPARRESMRALVIAVREARRGQ